MTPDTAAALVRHYAALYEKFQVLFLAEMEVRTACLASKCTNALQLVASNPDELPRKVLLDSCIHRSTAMSYFYQTYTFALCDMPPRNIPIDEEGRGIIHLDVMEDKAATTGKVDKDYESSQKPLDVVPSLQWYCDEYCLLPTNWEDLLQQIYNTFNMDGGIVEEAVKEVYDEAAECMSAYTRDYPYPCATVSNCTKRLCVLWQTSPHSLLLWTLFGYVVSVRSWRRFWDYFNDQFLKARSKKSLDRLAAHAKHALKRDEKKDVVSIVHRKSYQE